MQPYYSMIPTRLLKEIMSAKVTLPFETKRHARLDISNYKSARMHLDSAFHEALKMVSFPIRGRVTLHEFRDTFKTEASTTGVAFQASEFLLGHTVDKAGYDKSWRDEAWIWSEISKVYQKNEL